MQKTTGSPAEVSERDERRSRNPASHKRFGLHGPLSVTSGNLGIFFLADDVAFTATIEKSLPSLCEHFYWEPLLDAVNRRTRAAAGTTV